MRQQRDPPPLTVCVAIPTYNREKTLVETLEQVFAQDSPADEVLVIDQSPDHEPETTAFLDTADKAGKIRWIRQSPPNLPKARNRALRETHCDVVVFIDDDVELPTNFVENHLRNYGDGQVAAVAGRTVQANGWSRRECSHPWPRLLDYRLFRLDSRERVEGIASFVGCNHSVRRRAIVELGGYDENYIGWAYREDSDAAIRLWKAGGLVVFDPSAELRHLAMPSGGCRLKTGRKGLPEWYVSFPATYFAFRHLFPKKWFWQDLLLKNVRRYVLRRHNVFCPWRLPWAAASYGYAFLRAAWLASRRRIMDRRAARVLGGPSVGRLS